MLFSCLSLALSVSVDSLGIGITYGLRKTKVSTIAKVILFCTSFMITTISIYLGSAISNILPAWTTKLIGIILLMGMGIFIILQAIRKKENPTADTISNSRSMDFPKRSYQLFIKSLGITIQIIRDPISSDLDHSKLIDAKEATYLGFALSIDALCVGIGSSIIGISSMLFPLLVSIFQLLFLSFGIVLGKKVLSASHIPENVWSIISGTLLILIGR